MAHHEAPIKQEQSGRSEKPFLVSFFVPIGCLVPPLGRKELFTRRRFKVSCARLTDSIAFDCLITEFGSIHPITGLHLLELRPGPHE